MNTFGDSNPFKLSNTRLVIGTLLFLAGGVLFLDRQLRTGWLSLAVLPGAALFVLYWGLRLKHSTLILAGSIMAGLGIGTIAAFGPTDPPLFLSTQIGLLALYFGAGWGGVVIIRAAFTPKPAWWAMLPAGVLGGLGYCLLFTPIRWSDFILGLSIGIGVPLLVWGFIAKLIGLAIPGSLITTTGLGIFWAWQTPDGSNPLVNTGIMLVWFALGWAMITISGRVIMRRFLWWPLIPGGILAMVGWGLYIGGDPGNALGFIGNTGSIGLMIFGLYLLLMRKGIHH